MISCSIWSGERTRNRKEIANEAGYKWNWAGREAFGQWVRRTYSLSSWMRDRDSTDWCAIWGGRATTNTTEWNRGEQECWKRFDSRFLHSSRHLRRYWGRDISGNLYSFVWYFWVRETRNQTSLCTSCDWFCRLARCSSGGKVSIIRSRRKTSRREIAWFFFIQVLKRLILMYTQRIWNITPLQ